jgi:drug/metabolite transporter (DMT)-like permease
LSRRGWLLFVTMCVVWGVPYLLIKVAVEEMSPATLVLARTAIGAALLLPFVLVRRQLQPVLARWRPLLAFAVIEVTVPWWLLGYAEQRLDSSLTGLLVAGVPLVGALLVRFDPGGDRLDGRRYLGLLVGFLGVAALVGFEVGSGDATAALAVAAVAVCYATGPLVISRYLADLPGPGVITAALGVAAVLSAPLGIAQAPDHWPDGDALLSVGALAVVCTAVAFVVFFQLIAEVGATRATVFTYVNPAVAAVLGALVLDEQLSAATGLGFGLILLGCVLATGRGRPRPAPDCEAADVPAEDLARSLNAEP